MLYKKQDIVSKVERCLAEEMNNDDVQDIFLMMKMSNDLGDDKHFRWKTPSLESINMNLLGNGVLDEKDFMLKEVNARNQVEQNLEVRLSPSRTLNIIKPRHALVGTVNNNSMGMISLGNHDSEEIASWIVRQKQYMESYQEEWERVLKDASKKTKNHRMALLAIKAIFTDTMKDYQGVKYEFIVQKRRVRVKVQFPNSKLGVMIDAWWGSYKQRLPKQIDALRKMIETHREVEGVSFFVSYR